jgi:hypothetical protein
MVAHPSLIMKTTLLSIFTPCFISIFAAGCAATQLHPGAERVLVSHTPAPSDCRFVGTVVGDQGGALTGPLTSNRNLAEGAFNDLKNRAQEMGANYVTLESSTAGNTISGNRRSISGQETDVTHVGNAFICPAQPAPTSSTASRDEASR